MPSGPLFAPEDTGTHGNGFGDGVESTKDAFPNSDPEPVVVCQPAKKKKAAPANCTVDKIKKNLEACDGGTGAWAAAKKAAGADPTVAMKATTTGFDAETQGNNITIKPTADCCDATESLLFELHNVEVQPVRAKTTTSAEGGNLSREAYTKEMEHLEYDGLKRSWTTFPKCSKTWGCGPGVKSFAAGFSKAKSFDDYYNHQLANSHKNVYRHFWDSQYKDPYKKKHKKP